MANIGEREQLKNGAGAAGAVVEPPRETEDTSETGTPEAPEAPEAEEPKRGRGRPPKPVEPSIGFFARLKNLTLDEWENHMAYLYRTQPMTDAKKGGASSNYVTKYGQAFDEEVVKHECGSGGYKILFNRIGSDGKQRTIQVYFFDILDPKFPPKIPPGSWMDDPRNEKWAWAKAAYEEQGKTPQPAATAGGDSMESALDAVGRIIQVVKPGDGASADPITQLNAVSALLDRHKPPQPAPPPAPPDPVAQFAALAAALKDLRPETPSTESHNNLIIKLMDQVTDLTNKITQMRAPAAPSSSLNEALDTIEKLKGLFPTDSQNPWIGAITTLADKLGPAAEAYAEHHGMHRPASAPTGQPSPEAASPPGSAARSRENKEAFAVYRNIMLQVAGPMIGHLHNGQSGDDFAIWFVDGYGPGFHKQLKAIGKEQIMQVIASMPEVWGQLQPMQEVFSVFLDEFLAWEPPPEESDQTLEMPPMSGEPTQ